MANSVENCVFDHLVVGARDLTVGAEWFTQVFESDISVGGKHPQMSTHNLLSSFTDNSFLEIIAIDPEPPPPAHPRWFSLDSPATQQQLLKQPKLLTWVVGTANLDLSIKQLKSLGFDVGRATELQRGELRWRLSVPENGVLVENGVIPSLIEWPPGTHPASKMQSNRLCLREITLRHPEPDKIKQALRLINAEHLATVVSAGDDKPSLSASIDGPAGQRTVS